MKNDEATVSSIQYPISGIQITVYWWGLDVDSELAEGLGRLLDPEERSRGARFVTHELQRRYTVAHGGLRLILSSLLAVPPGVLAFERGSSGKPKLAATLSTARGLHFNFSHSLGLACVAVSPNQEVGVDVECERSMPDALELLRTILNPPEYAVAVAKPGMLASELAGVLRKCWTMKEAVLKACGCGLSVDPREVLLNPLELNAVLHGESQGCLGRCGTSIVSRAMSWKGQAQSFAFPAGTGAVATSGPGSAVDLELLNVSEQRLQELIAETTVRAHAAQRAI